MALSVVITLILMILKLTGNINWNWWMVMSPLIIVAITWLCAAFFVFLVYRSSK